MNRKQVGLIVLVSAIIVGGIFYFTKGKKTAVKQIQINGTAQQTTPLNQGNVSPLSGLPCENWNRRSFAVMQPSDVSARPAAGFSQADMVFEVPVITAVMTRLMGVYVCENPDDIGSMRSARHDYIALAKGLDSIFVHWGGSHYAIDKLKEGVIDDMNCNNDGGKSAAQYCYRKPQTGTMKGDDTGYAKFAQLLQGAQDFGYRMTNKFVGYPHQAEAALDQRGKGGHLRLAYPRDFKVEYDYDRANNTYLRTWGGVADTDRNNGNRIAPKNVAVLVAASSQLVEGEQYNNVQIGDPWYDTSDSGDATYYMNGQQIKGSWKKDKSSLDSKMFFYDADGKEIQFVPGQIWVNVIEPGQAVEWTPAA
ncbi:MAG: DUF3048 domain-containing protein [Candidatus Moranbacteria bacterium]|nr:DUF3048 domain-containing protein [Candidatus Moranbacteria bacterium]